MLLRDFLEAYQESLNIVGFFKAIWKILCDLKFWAVIFISLFILIFPFAWLMAEHEKQENEKIEAHIILYDGREFFIKKSQIKEYENVIEFTTNSGENIKSTLYTIKTKTKQ